MYQVLFELRPGEANYGKIVITNSNPLQTGNERAYIRITRPGGTIIKEQDLNAPDIDLPNTVDEYTINIPTTTDGGWLAGTYLVEVAEDQSTDPGIYSEFEYEFYWCPLELSAAIGFVANCVCARITVTDATQYGTATVISRTLTLIPPRIPGEPIPSATTSSESSMVVAFSWANVKYQVMLESEIEREIIPGVLSNEAINKTQWFDVVCDYDFCGLISCVVDEYQRLINLASQKGGLKNLPDYELDVWLKLNRDFQLHNAYIACGDYEAAQDMYNQIKEDLRCECGCGSASSRQPVAVSAACGGEEGAEPITLDNVYPVIVALSGSVWTVSLDSTWLAKVNALRNTVVTSTDSTIDVSSSYYEGTNTITYDLSIPADDWTYLVIEDFSAEFQDVLTNKAAYRLTKENDVEVLCKFSSENEVLIDGTEYPMFSAPLPIAYRPASNSGYHPVVADTGEVIGYAVLKSDGNIYFRAAVDFWTGSDPMFFRILANKTVVL